MFVSKLNPLVMSQDQKVHDAQKKSLVALPPLGLFQEGIKSAFEHLGTVFLQISKNRQAIQFNGKITIEANTFTNYKGASISVLELEIRAKEIKNRGFLTTRGFEQTHINCNNKNKSPLDDSTIATTDLILEANRIDNRKGSIESVDGVIGWISGRHAVLNNDQGTLFGKQGIKRQDHPKPASKLNLSKPSTRLLMNRKGTIKSPHGLIDLDLPYIDNTEGYFQGQIGKMHVDTFLNKHGQLIIAHRAELNVAERFDNEFGLLEASDALILKNGIWQNSGGVISASLGIQACVKEFANTKKGYVFSSKGKVKIATKRDLTQKGIIDAARGIMLLTEEGVYWGINGLLFTPQLISIESTQCRVELEEAAIHATHLNVKALAQINLEGIKLKLQVGLNAFSKTQWIDALNIDFSNLCGKIQLDAEKYVNLENSTGIVKGDLYINCRSAALKKNDLTILGDVDFEVELFNAQNNSLNLPSNSYYKLESKDFIYSQSNALHAPKSMVNEKAGMWISKEQDSTTSRAISRQTKHLTIRQSDDAAKTITLEGLESLCLQHYSGDADSLEVYSGGSAYLQKVNFDADRTRIEVYKLWLADSTIRYEQAKLIAQEAIALMKVDSAGKRLKMKVKGGALSVHKSRNRTDRSKLKAKTKIDLTENTFQGSLKSTSEKQQYIANNCFVEGDFQATSTQGDLTFDKNQFWQKRDITLEAPQGVLRASDTFMQADNISSKSKEVSIERGKLEAHEKIDLTANRSFISQLKASAEEANLTSTDALVLDSATLKTAQGMHITSENFLLMQNTSVSDPKKIETKAQIGLVERSLVTSGAGSISLEMHKSVVVENSEIDGKNTSVSSAYAIFKESVVNSKESVDFKGNLTAQDSVLSSQKSLTAKGKDLYLDHTEVNVEHGNLSITMESELIKDSSLTATDINERSREITILNSRAVAQHKLSRIADSIVTRYGNDIATNIFQRSSQQSHVDQLLHASDKVDLVSFDLDLSRSSIFGSLSARSTGTLSAPNAKLYGPQINLNAGTNLNAPNLQAESSGTLYLHAGINLNAPHLQAQSSGPMEMHAGENSFLSHATLNTSSSLGLLGNQIDRGNSQISAHSLIEVGDALDASYSTTYVSNNVLQKFRSGMIDLKGSTTYAGGSLTRYANDMNHTGATSYARDHFYDGTYFNNCGGTLAFGGGSSRLNFGQVDDDSSSRMFGNGSLQLNVGGDHVQRAEVFLSSFDLSARKLTTEGPISTSKVNLRSTDANLTLKAPVTSDWGTFTSPERIVNNSRINLSQHGDFKCYQVDNLGSISSDGGLTFDQRAFKDLDNVHAENSLVFISDDSIDTYNSYTPENLALLSRQGHVHLNAPLHLKNNFRAQGSGIEINAPLHAGGFGNIQTPGKLLFNENSSFGTGLDVEADTVRNHAKDVNVKGNSRIVCNDFEAICSLGLPTLSRGWFRKKYIGTDFLHGYTPATFHFQDDLYLNARVSALNDASNIFVEGNLFLDGHDFKNLNRTHVHSYQVENGSYRTYWGWGPKKKTYAWKHELKVDSVANLQVGKAFNLNLSGKLTNDGVIHAGWINGNVKEIDNGIFNNLGSMPKKYHHGLKSLTGNYAFKTGGEIYSQYGTHLKVDDHLRNVGSIESDGYMSVESRILLNEHRITEESEQVVSTGAYGRKKVRYKETDHSGQEWSGKIRGRGPTEIIIGEEGRNVGGKIEGESFVRLQADHFSNEMQPIRMIKHFKAGVPWRITKGYDSSTHYVPGNITSGGDMEVGVSGTFYNRGASGVVSFGNLGMEVGNLESEMVSVTSQISQVRKWNKSGDEYILKKFEPNILSITGDLLVKSSKGDLNFAGKVGSYGGHAKVESARDINWIAQTIETENWVDSLTFTPTTISFQNTIANTTLTSIPEFFSGGGHAVMVAKGNIGGTADFTSMGDLIARAESISLTSHEVHYYSETTGYDFSASFFGSSAIEAAYRGEGFNPLAKALLSEDPLIASAFSAFKLASANGNMDRAFQGLMTAAHTWQAATQLAPVYASGSLNDLEAVMGNRVGLTDKKGKFDPRINFRVGIYGQSEVWTNNIPTTFQVKGNIDFQTILDQSYHGCQVVEIGGGASFVGRKINFSAAVDHYSMKRSNFGATVGFGPDGISFGGDATIQVEKSLKYQKGGVNFGNLVRIEAEALTLSGICLNAKVAKVNAKKIDITSLLDYSSQMQIGGSASTSGNLSFFGADASSTAIGTVAGIVAEGGHVTTDHLTMAGGLLKNLEVDAKKLDASDLSTYSQSNSFGLNLNTKQFSESNGINLLGDLRYSQESQEGMTRASMIGCTGVDDAKAFNTEEAAVQQNFKRKKIEVIAPLLIFDFDQLKKEANIISDSISPSKVNRVVVPTPLPQKSKMEHNHVERKIIDSKGGKKVANQKLVLEETASKSLKKDTTSNGEEDTLALELRRAAYHSGMLGHTKDERILRSWHGDENNELYPGFIFPHQLNLQDNHHLHHEKYITSSESADNPNYATNQDNSFEEHIGYVRPIKEYYNYNLAANQNSSSPDDTSNTTSRPLSLLRKVERVIEKKKMMDASVLASGLDTLALPFVWGFEVIKITHQNFRDMYAVPMEVGRIVAQKTYRAGKDVCANSKTCQAVTSTYQETKEAGKELAIFVGSKLSPATVPLQWVNSEISKLIKDYRYLNAERVKYNKEVLDILEAETHKFHRDVKYIVETGAIAVALPYIGKGLGAAAKFFKNAEKAKPNFRSAPRMKSEITPTGNRNPSVVNFAKDVTPKPNLPTTPTKNSIVAANVRNQVTKPSYPKSSTDLVPPVVNKPIIPKKIIVPPSSAFTTSHVHNQAIEHAFSTSLPPASRTLINKTTTALGTVLPYSCSPPVINAGSRASEALFPKKVNNLVLAGINENEITISPKFIVPDSPSSPVSNVATKPIFPEKVPNPVTPLTKKTVTSPKKIVPDSLSLHATKVNNSVLEPVPPKKFTDPVPTLINETTTSQKTIAPYTRLVTEAPVWPKGILPRIAFITRMFLQLDKFTLYRTTLTNEGLPIYAMENGKEVIQVILVEKNLTITLFDYVQNTNLFNREKKHFFNSIKRFKQEALQNGSKSLVVEIEPQSEFILEYMKKKFPDSTYLGTSLRNHFGHKPTEAWEFHRYLFDLTNEPQSNVKPVPPTTTIEKAGHDINSNPTLNDIPKATNTRNPLSQENELISTKPHPLKSVHSKMYNRSMDALQLFQVEFPPLKSTIDDIYRKINIKNAQNAQDSMASNVKNVIDESKNLLPSFRPPPHINNIWLEAVRRTTPLENATYHRLEKIFEDSKKKIVRMSFVGDIYLVAEDSVHQVDIVNKLLGFEFLRSLPLSEITIPRVLTSGTHYNENRYFLVEQYLNGKKLLGMLEKLASPELDASMKASYLHHLRAGFEQTGKALRELQNIGLKHKTKPSAGSVQTTIEAFSENLKVYEKSLASLGLSLGKIERFEPLIEAFRQSPGRVSYNFGKPTLGNYVWSPPTKTLGFLGSKSLLKSITPEGNPFKDSAAFTSRDKYNFIEEIYKESVNLDLKPFHFMKLIKAFEKGYAQGKGSESLAAENFFKANSIITITNFLVANIPNNPHLNRDTISSYLLELEGLLSQKPRIMPKFKEEAGLIEPLPINDSMEIAIDSVQALKEVMRPTKTKPSLHMQDVIKIAGAFPKEGPILKLKDIDTLIRSSIIPNYGIGIEAKQTLNTINKFVTSTLNAIPHKVLSAEQTSFGINNRHDFFLVLDENEKAIAVVKEFFATKFQQQEFIQEIVSNNYLHLKLPHLSLPKMLDIGKYIDSSNSERGLILYEFIPGKSVKDLMDSKSSDIPIKLVGKAIGGINATHSFTPVDPDYLQRKIDWLRFEANSVLDKLEILGLETHFTMDDVEKVIEGVKKNPGRAGLVHGDASIQNLMIHDSQVFITDTSTLMESVNEAGIPHGLPALDKHLMLISLFSSAIENNYSIQETNKLASSFRNGYVSICPDLTPESERFAELFWELFTISGAKDDSNLLVNTLERVNAKFKSAVKTVENVKEVKEVKEVVPFDLLKISAKHKTTIDAIFSNPIQSDVIWNDIESLVLHMDGEIIEGNGSRVKFVLNGVMGSFHRPHRKETDKGALKSVRRFLLDAGVKND